MDNSDAAEVIVQVCWVVFALYWLVSAFAVKKTAQRESVRIGLPYRVVQVVGFGLIVYYALPRTHLFELALPGNAVLHTVGALVCVFGLGVTVWARWTLAGNWSSEVAVKQDHELIQRGPYRLVRHPIYSGLLLMTLATAVVYGQLGSLVGVGFVALAFWLKLTQEEVVMAEHFPDQYPDYGRRVKALIPFVL